MQKFLPRALPENLQALTELALNLHWTWNHALDELWARVDPELWKHTRNPWTVLQNVSRTRLEALQHDDDFLHALEQAIENRECYRQQPGLCSQAQGHDPYPNRIAYFSMEFGLSEALRLYAGGLGILAGDYLKTASDLDVPAIGVGLLYQEGYFRQTIDTNGRQHALYPFNDPSDLPIQPVMSDDGGWLDVRLGLPGRILYLRVWQATIGRASLYLLDSNDIRNGPVDRGITSKLYGGGSEMRLLQEVVLGIAGWHMLEIMKITPEVCHLNEGHAALAVLERARSFMHENNTTFEEAWWTTRAGNVFTTHTPVAAGFDAFPSTLITKYAHDYLRDFDMPLRDLLALGRRNPDDDNEPFNMAYLALRGCAQTNAVSRLHGEVSRKLFSGLYPRWPLDEVPVSHVTNGIHVPSWDSAWADDVWTRTCGKQRWLDDPQSLTEAINGLDDETLWSLATRQRKDLVHYARKRMARQLGQRGESETNVAETRSMLDPNILTLGFARRFAEYKRPNLLLHDPDRLARLLTDPQRPVQLLVAGKAHPDDDRSKTMIQDWLNFCHRPDVRRHVVFLEDYDIALAQQLVQGVDVWINTPRRPWEACGTSGMKTLVNGGLNLSKLDGWWAEAYRPECGWGIGGDGNDDEDVELLYRILENEVVPVFYARDNKGIPREWVQRMRASMSELAPRFSSNRMLLEYWYKYYQPAAGACRRRCENGAALGRSLREWERELTDKWHEVHMGPSELCQEGETRHVNVPVYLGDLHPENVRVELYAARDDSHPAECLQMRLQESMPGSAQGYIFTAVLPDGDDPGRYTARVRAWHGEAFLPSESTLIAWQR